MGKEDTLTILNLQAEIDRLNKKILFLERTNREQSRELNDYALRENQLLEEINSLSALIESDTRDKRFINSQPAADVEDFLHPKVDTGTGLNRVDTSGFETEWEDFMYAYTDEIFVQADSPDTLLFRDDIEKCYLTPTGKTRLPFPILQEDLERLNIIKIRPLTDDELKQVEKDYEL